MKKKKGQMQESPQYLEPESSSTPPFSGFKKKGSKEVFSVFSLSGKADKGSVSRCGPTFLARNLMRVEGKESQMIDSV